MSNLTSEARYGLPKQPKETCPIVDAGQKALNRFFDNQPSDRQLRNADEDDLRSMLEAVTGDLDYYKGDVEDALEHSRQQSVDIREWGQAWKDLAKENLAKVEAIKTPWDGLVLWWNEVGESRWRETWVYKAGLARHVAHRRDAKLAVI
jgi:hypothetical protein